MALNETLSLIAVIAMAIAFWASGMYMESNIVFILQIAAYLLLAASSWLIGVRAAAFVLAMCAITLTLKTLRRFPAHVMFIFLLVALAGGLIVNNSGWLGMLPILAGLGVIYRHAYAYTMPSLAERFDIHYPLDIEKWHGTLFPKMDNAYRLPRHAVDLFLYNIVGVVLWGVYAWQVGDRYMMIWRGIMLFFNVINYARRIWPTISRMLARALPAPDRYKRRRYPGKKGKRDWVI